MRVTSTCQIKPIHISREIIASLGECIKTATQISKESFHRSLECLLLSESNDRMGQQEASYC